MGSCRYLNNLYKMQCDKSYTYDELDFEDSLDFDTEEVGSFDTMMRESNPAEVTRIFNLLNSQFQYLYRELEGFGLNRNTISYIFRYIVSYTIDNQKMATGEPEQRTTALLNELRRSSPWIFYILRSYGVPEARINQIVRTLIAFTLSNIQTTPPTPAPPPPVTPPAPPESLEQRATRITNLIRQQTNTFREIQNFGINANTANTIVRNVVLFVLRNTTPTQPPANIEVRAAQLLRSIESSNPGIIRELQGYGIPAGRVRTIIRSIIVFTLRNIYPK